MMKKIMTLKSNLMHLTGAELLLLFIASYAISLPMLIMIIMALKGISWGFSWADKFLDKDLPGRFAFGAFCGFSCVGIIWLIHLG